MHDWAYSGAVVVGYGSVQDRIGIVDWDVDWDVDWVYMVYSI